MIRIDQLIVGLVVTVVLFSCIFLVEAVFTSSFDKNNNAYNAEFDMIAHSVRSEDYSKAGTLCDQVLSKEEVGMNAIKANAYLGIVKLRMHQDDEALQIFRDLMNTYPGIKLMYEEQFQLDHSSKNVNVLFTGVLNYFVPTYKKAVLQEVTLLDVIAAMEVRDWMWFVFVVLGSVVMYERIRKKYTD